MERLTEREVEEFKSLYDGSNAFNIRRKLRSHALQVLLQSDKLIGLQKDYLGSDHPELASTYHDAAESLSSLLDRDAEYLKAKLLGKLDWATSESAIAEQLRLYRAEGKRVKSLYCRAVRFPRSIPTAAGLARMPLSQSSSRIMNTSVGGQVQVIGSSDVLSSQTGGAVVIRTDFFDTAVKDCTKSIVPMYIGEIELISS